MTTKQVSELKKVTTIGVIKAITRGKIDARKDGRSWFVLDNERLQQWVPIHDLAERGRRGKLRNQ